MKVLIVGGSGFIGSRLISTLLDRGHDVANLDRQPSAPHPALTTVGDILDRARLADAAADRDAVINLAAEHRDDVQPLSRYQEVNVDGAHTLISVLEEQGIHRLVFTSSVAVYGLDNNDAAEDTPPEPFNEYGRTKLEAEGAFRTWAEGDPACSLVIVRPSVVFGEHNRGNVYTLASQVASGRFLMVGDGSNRKSMSYVGNLVEYLADSLEAPAGEKLTNFADKPDLSTKELIALLKDAMNLRGGTGPRIPLALGLAGGHAFDAVARLTRRTFPISAIRVKKFVADTTVNTDRLQASGYRPRYTLEDALRRTIASEFPTAKQVDHA
jgi:nucleoside-diphosphate-sugar epimerase